MSTTSTARQNYDSHKWDSTYQSYGASEPGEWVTWCPDCGCEDYGDPDEFPELEYPPCEREDP